MTPAMIAIGALAILFFYASYLAFRFASGVEEYQRLLDVRQALHEQALLSEQGARSRALADLEAYRREVEQKGYKNIEVQRLRDANGRLALQLEEVADLVGQYLEALDMNDKRCGPEELLEEVLDKIG